MSKLEELYSKSEFSALPNKSVDKTPIEADGGKVNTSKYSDTIKR